VEYTKLVTLKKCVSFPDPLSKLKSCSNLPDLTMGRISPKKQPDRISWVGVSIYRKEIAIQPEI
jgi:hypothetical protein